MHETQNTIDAPAMKGKPHNNVDAVAVFTNKRASTFALVGDGYELINCLPNGPFETTYEPIAAGQPPTWGVKGTLDLAGRDGNIRTYPFHVTESDFEKPEIFIPAVCGTDVRVNNDNGTLTIALEMYRKNPQAFPRQTTELYRTAEGVFELGLKLADRPVRIVGEAQNQYGETLYIVQCIGRDGVPHEQRVSHEDLFSGSWVYQFGGRTSEAVRLAAALTSEWKARR